jgi:uncharacterized protein (DUF1697 family)
MGSSLPLRPYVAFLRGINVGGHHKISMGDLRQAFAGLGFQNVKTVLASGNVRFETPREDAGALSAEIAARLRETFGYEIAVILRTGEQIQALVDSDPFAGIEVTPETRRYVTFLPEKPRAALQLPYESEDGSFRILRITGSEVCSVLNVTQTRSVDEMAVLEKEFGKQITTRNWNTVLKLL